MSGTVSGKFRMLLSKWVQGTNEKTEYSPEQGFVEKPPKCLGMIVYKKDYLISGPTSTTMSLESIDH